MVVLIGLAPIARKGTPPDVAYLVLQHRHWQVWNLGAADRTLVRFRLVHRS
jgi:hypothetical protein